MLKKRLAESAVSQFKTLLRFENQDLGWSVNDLHYYSEAFARGLLSNQLQGGQKVLFWLDEAHSAEYISSLYGTFKAGLTPVALSKSLKAEDISKPRILREFLQEQNASAVIFSPNQRIGSNTKADILLNSIPEAVETGNKGLNGLKGLPNLKFLIQTGFFAKNGLIKFRDFLVYPTKNYSLNSTFDKLQGVDELETRTSTFKQKINSGDQVFVVSNFENHDFVLRAILETLASGNLLTFLPGKGLEKSDMVFANEADPTTPLLFFGSSNHLELLKSKLNHPKVNLISA